MARKLSKFRLFLLTLSALFGAAACSGSDFAKIGIQVDPLCAAVAPGTTQQFNARIFIDDVDQGIDNAAVNWSVLGGDVNGVVDANGLYTAPDTNPPPAVQVTVVATSKEDDQKEGQATAVLSGACPVVPPPTQSF
ncbi:MAG: hypothetical protein IT573_01730 [Deltaproteobacteria bacterium]|nr:hypothetical protein [Deltaproteobacteria bacterium]